MINREGFRAFGVPDKPYVFRVDEVVALGGVSDLRESTPIPNFWVVDGHASKRNGIWAFANGTPVVEGVHAWNLDSPNSRVSLVVACSDVPTSPQSIDFAPFEPSESIYSVWGGDASAIFGLNSSGRVVGYLPFYQYPRFNNFISRFPTFSIR